MGHKMGMPSLKLNNAGVKSKSCGSFRSVAEEGLEERVGHDPDIDRERSQQNIYTGYRSAAELMEYSQKHVDQLRDARGRKLRSDAVVMCATVLKPPAAYMATLPREEQIRLLDVAEGVLAKIVGPENIKATGTHFDEQGTHRHVFWEPMTPDGRLCAKEMHNLQFFAKMNREIPAALREAGFEIDDCEMYDAAKEEYEKEKAKAGRSSFQFKADAEKAKQELERQVEELDNHATAMQGMVEHNTKRLATLQETAYQVELDVQAKQGQAQAAEDRLQRASDGMQKLREGLEAARGEVDGLRVEKRSLTASVSDLKAKRDALTEEVSILQEAAKREYSAGAKTLSLDEWERRIADARQRSEQQKKIKELEAKVNLYERFISSFPDILQKFRSWYAELQQRQQKKKRSDRGYGE